MAGRLGLMNLDGDPNQKPSNRLDRSSLGSMIFGLVIMVLIESCVLGVVVLIWMIDNGYLFK